jgi:hypothetical protein
MKVAIITLLSAGLAAAQQTVAPTPEPVGPPRGDNTAEYNIVNSFETGYRWSSIGGNEDEYKSQVNYDSGVRLLGSFLSINSRDGHGRYFDEILLNTQGLGNDPYESVVARVQKNRLYRFDMTWRLNDYVNPGLVSGGQSSGNLRDTRFTSQDDDLTLFPQSKTKFFLGYSRYVQDGPAFTSVGGFFAPTLDTTGVSTVRDARNEYRIGNEIQFLGIRLNWIRGWEDFKEDFRVIPQSDTGEPLPPEFRNPYHGTGPYWRVALFTEKKWFSVNGRFTYTNSQRAYVSVQSGLIGGATPGLGGLQVFTMGTGNRPVATGNLTFTVFPTSKLSITNSTAVYNIRTSGNSQFLQFNDGTGRFQIRDFAYMGIRTIANQTNLNYQATKWLSAYGGYNYSDRFIRNILDSPVNYDHTSILNAGVFGVRIKPIQPVTIVLGGEVGHANHPFTPKSDGKYQTLNARVQYKRKSLLLSAHVQTDYNNNSTSLTSYSSHARTYAANASWTPRRWVSFNADYVKLHLDSLGGLAFFDSGELLQNQYSLYISNLQTGNIGVRFVLGRRADLYAGYSHVQDTGDGRSSPTGSGFGPDIPEFQRAQTFPLKFQSPLARLSVKITNRIRWNLGYQYYGYREDFFTGQEFTTNYGYRAQTGYTSILWSF